MKSKRGIVVITATLAALASAFGVSAAGWSTTNTGSASALAKTMPTGSQPSATVTNRDVAVSWAASQITTGTNVSGYLVKRYSGAVAQTVNASCSGNVTGVTCTELGVLPGTYTYTVTPLQGDLSSGNHWIGVEGPASTNVTVGSTTFSGTSPTSVTSLPATITGTLSNFVDNQSLTFHLDSAGGTTLTGTPSSISSTGGASANVTLPAGTANGNHTIYAVTANGDSAASSTINVNLPPAGLALTGITTNTSPAMSCSGTAGAITCSSTGEANSTGNVLTAQLLLTDASGNAYTNTSGSAIQIDVSGTGNGSVSPATLSVANNASSTGSTLTATRTTGNNKSLTVTATIHGTTKKITITMAS